jgi:hypothetical protein
VAPLLSVSVGVVLPGPAVTLSIATSVATTKRSVSPVLSAVPAGSGLVAVTLVAAIVVCSMNV